MAVGEYVRGKALQHDAPTSPGGNQAPKRSARELAADAARVKVPTTRLNGTSAPASGERETRRPTTASRSPRKGAERYAQHSQSKHRDVFDTDVETVDDSTITVPSVRGGESTRHDIQIPPGNRFISRGSNDLPLNAQYDQVQSGYRNSFEERMLRELGSDPLEDEHDDVHYQNEHYGPDDGAEGGTEDFEEDAQIFDWTSNQATNGEPLSWQKIEAALRDTNKPSSPVRSSQENANPASGTKQSDHERYPDHIHTPKTQKHPSGNRFVARSRFGTPNLRDDALHEEGRLVGARPVPQSPTRTVILSPQSQGDPQLGGGLSLGPNQPNPLRAMSDNDDQYNQYNSGGLFDITDLSAIDSTTSATTSDNQATCTSLRLSTLSPVSSKRPLTAFSSDYPTNILETKSFSDLRAESFDYNPAPPQPIFPPQDPPLPLAEKLTRLKALTDDQRQTFFASLTLTEWEESGDWLIEQFSLLLKKSKDARHERRQVAAVFEKEIERRYELVQTEGKEIGERLEEMRTGGMGVLKGRTS
ncbi:hypothetical protein AJ79_06381 [Helicocarpus griseus UAMH5409]|uniref:Extracellular mutant protein 11 C-terminal domain-containing protein n=1 Tax=Helicocarpus griseus UAMH5409 TaxID=1447875 RepID=A0A2B7XEE1_9EURO|nr:hypothetical protein AJ79_06381 [Helicocarpus griseus UAMH5409]